jgi:hypothetical protein
MIRTTIGQLPERLALEPVTGPLLLLIGGVFAEKAERAGGDTEATVRSA